MKKLNKVLSVLMIVLMVACVCTNVFAVINPSDISTSGTSGDTSGADETILKIGNTILNIVTNVGMILAVILVAILGVKYMMGSAEEKSEYKKSMIPYLVGAILIFGASAIGKAVIEFGQSIIK